MSPLIWVQYSSHARFGLTELRGEGSASDGIETNASHRYEDPGGVAGYPSDTERPPRRRPWDVVRHGRGCSEAGNEMQRSFRSRLEHEPHMTSSLGHHAFILNYSAAGVRQIGRPRQCQVETGPRVSLESSGTRSDEGPGPQARMLPLCRGVESGSQQDYG